MSKHTKEYYAKWREKNRDAFNKYQIEYYHKNKDRIIESRIKNRNENLEREKEKRRNWNRKVRIEFIEFLGGKCKKCGFLDWRALQIDHINGDGGKDRKSYGHTNSALYTDIKINPGKYQLLCANCNWIKRHENGEHFWKVKNAETSNFHNTDNE